MIMTNHTELDSMIGGVTNSDKTFTYFKLCSIEPITPEQAMIYQAKKDKLPQGYGFEGFKCVKYFDSLGRDYYEATWLCYSSCD